MDTEKGKLIQRPSNQSDQYEIKKVWSKKKKAFVGISSLIVLGAIVLLIVLLVNKKSDNQDDNNDNNDNNTDVLNYQEYNPFSIPADSPVQKTVFYYNGYLENKNQTNYASIKNLKSKFRSFGAQQMKYKPVDPQKIPTGPNNEMKPFVQFNFSLVNNYESRIQIAAVNGSKNYSVTNESSPRIVQEFEARFTQLGFNISGAGEPFGWSMKNIYNNETILNTTNRKMIIQDKYSEIGFVLPNDNIFGLGIANRQFKLQTNSTYTLWSKGRQEEFLEVDQGNGAQQSSQVLPFILGQANNKNDWYGIFFVGSAAQSFELIYVPNKTQVIFNYITLSDQLELYVIMRGTPKQIIQRYQHQIGYPSLPPFYALGIFAGSQKSTIWSNSQKLQAQIDNYISQKLPIEGVLLDQYTEDNIYPFTQDDLEGFGDVRQFQTYLKGKNMKMILGIQSQIPQDTNLIASNKALLWLQSTKSCIYSTGTNCTAGSYGNLTSQNQIAVGFVDVFNNDSAYQFYDQAFSYLNNSVSTFDGIYLRGNTPFVKTTSNQQQPQGLKVPENPETDGQIDQHINSDQSVVSYNNFPYIPGYLESGDLKVNTIDSGYFHQGFKNTNPSHIEGVPHQFVHNMYGFVQNKIVWNTLLKQSTNRPNIYSESAWAGTGFYGGSFNQPLSISWESLQNSISMAMTAGINGINNWVTEVCGVESFGDSGLTDDQLEICTRWVELAVYLPMIRIKGDLSDYLVNNQDRSQNIISALNQRLSITRYIYSQMFANNYTGGSLVYPLYFDYPEDETCLYNIEQSFMLGDTLKISPVISQNSNQFYFPPGKWRSLNDFTQVIDTSKGGENKTLNTKLGQTQVHIKDGKILPWQQSDSSKPQTTHDMTQQGITLIVNRDESNYADGFYLVDDGITQSNFADNLFTFWKIRFAEKAINFWVERGDYTFDITQKPYSQKIDQLVEILILGASDLEDSNTACYMGQNLKPVQLNISYNSTTQILHIKSSKNTVAFRDLGIIKFYNNQTEPNVCNTDTFQYSSTKDESSTDLIQKYNLVPKINQGNLKNLVAIFSLMDNEGTINFNLTYQDDYENNYKNIFRPINVIQNSQFNQQLVTQKLDQYLTVTLDPFAFSIKIDDNFIYSLDGSKLFMSDYLVMDSGIFDMNTLNDNPLMGMGERAGELFFQNEVNGVHSRWSHDAANPIDDGLPPGRNMYGFQPFYVFQSGVTNYPWVGVFNNNPYATDYIVNTNKGVKSNITTITIGGAIEKWFFVGKKPDDVIIKYEKLTGMPTMPPLWSFGWQQCRFGWVNDQVWLQVVQNYSDYNLPLDTMWADIDYMDDYKVFTISPVTYGNLSNQVKDIRKRNMTFVPIMDAGVAVRNEEYFALDKGKEMGIFIKQAYSDNPLTAGVWCGNAYFPDFYHPNAEDYWHQMFDRLFGDNGLEYDGIWLDMNEATNFCDGYCITDERPKNSLRNKPFYVPGSRDLESESLGVDGVHYADQNLFNKQNLTEYDVHNTFSLMQVKATASYLQKNNKRPYVLSRSNFQGLQKYGFHWLGDNWSWVEYMVASVKNIYEYQLFGLPFMGCDLCGFNGDAPSDLCTRWHQVGTLFPFARNHNQNATKSQEPYRFNETISQESSVTYTDLIRTAILNRYTMLRYYYSSFWSINQFGGSFFKPLFFEFPSDPFTYKDIEVNMLLGNGLKASVEVRRLPDGINDKSGFYFPQGTWCQIIPFAVTNMDQCIVGDGTQEKSNVTMDTGIKDYYIHMRNGYIIPLQNTTYKNEEENFHFVKNTKEQLDQFTDLYILPNSANQDQQTDNKSQSYYGAAVGYIYFDDGVSMDSYSQYTRIDFNYVFDYKNDTDRLQFNIMKNGYFKGHQNEKLGNVTIYGTFQNQTAQGEVKVQALLQDDRLVDLPFNFLDGDKKQVLQIQALFNNENLYFKDINEIYISQNQKDIFQE